MLYVDFPRVQEFADSETKRIITVHQLVAYYDHSWLNSSEPPDEATCKFWIAIDSLLTEEQSNKLSCIINANPNELTEAEINLREQFFSQDFRDMVINYQGNTLQELTNYTEIENSETIIKCLPDKNRFQRIMYLPDKDLTTEEKSLKYAFLQEAAKTNNSEWIEKFINFLGEPKQIEMPKELQNAMSTIDSVDNAKINGIVKDNVLDSIYDDFTNKFFELAEKNMLKKQLLSLLHSNKDFMLMFLHVKGSEFLKSCYEDINVRNNFENEKEFSQALYFKLNLYQQSKRLKILKLLLSEKSKLSDEIKQSLRIYYFEVLPGSIKKLARDELPLNKETLFKFYKKLFFIYKNDPEKIFNLLQKIVNDNKTIPELKKIIYKNVNRVLYLFVENENVRQKIFQDMLNTLPNGNDFDYSIDYSNEFKCAVKSLKENFNKLVLKSKEDENFIPPLIDDEHNFSIKD